MKRSRSALLILVSCGILFCACKKEAEPQTIPVPTDTSSATPVAADSSAAAADSAAATTAAADTAAAANPPTTPVAPGPAAAPKGQTIDACCKALAQIAIFSGKSPEAKAKASTGSKICYGLDKLVKDGKTSRAAALAQLRSSISGTTPPPECN